MSNQKVVVIMNEQHTLLEDQRRSIAGIANDGSFTMFPVPSKGWTYKEMLNIRDEFARECKRETLTIIFVSPVPGLLMMLSRHEGVTMKNGKSPLEVKVLHNDNRVAKELPGGKIIHTVAPTGWRVI